MPYGRGRVTRKLLSTLVRCDAAVTDELPPLSTPVAFHFPPPPSFASFSCYGLREHPLSSVVRAVAAVPAVKAGLSRV